MDRINKGFLQRIISENSAGITIVTYTVTDAVPRGDNFMSLTYRLELELTTGDNRRTKKHLILKLQPNNAIRRERFGTGRAFCNEVLIYKGILPAFVSFAKGKGVKNPLSSFPKCIGGMADGSVNDFLVLEDLKPLGFTMAEKRKCLGFKECELVMKALGEFHAFSLAMKEEDPEGFLALRRNLDEVLFRPERYVDVTLSIENNVDLAIRVFQIRNYDSNIIHRIGSLKNDVFSKMSVLIEPKEPMAVITHGDCWNNNSLFHHNNKEEVTEVKLLDLQISRYDSPAIDLQYFFCTSTMKSLRECHVKQLLHTYHATLTRTLQALGCKRDISFSTIEKEFRDYKLYGCIMAVWVLPYVLADSKVLPDFEEITEEDLANDEARKKWNATFTPAYEERILDLLCDCLSDGTI